VNFASLVKLNDCFFFEPLDETDVLKIVFFLSLVDGGLSLGGLVIRFVSDVCVSPSAIPSLPLLSFRHDSVARSVQTTIKTNKFHNHYDIHWKNGVYEREREGEKRDFIFFHVHSSQHLKPL
jgi:hypothetical protein